MQGRFTVSSPTRVDLAGGTLDLWPLYCLTENAKTINLALDLFAQVKFDYAPDSAFSLEAKAPNGATHTFTVPPSFAECRTLDPAVRFPVAVASNYLSFRRELPSIKIQMSWTTSVPMGSGLGGSSALGVGLLRGISRIFGEYSGKGWEWELLAAIKDMEAAFLEVPTGTQDYLAALFGGLSCFQSRPGSIVHSPYRAQVFEAISERILVLFSGEQHHSGRSNWEIYKGGVEKDPDILRGLHGIRGIAESLDVELRSSEVDWKLVGRAMVEEWKIRRELFKVSTPRLDELLKQLSRQPILGAKVCGAAAGGSILVLLDPEHRTSVAQKMEKAGIQVLPTQPTPKGVTVA